jgi:hypothetical protein
LTIAKPAGYIAGPFYHDPGINECSHISPSVPGSFQKRKGSLIPMNLYAALAVQWIISPLTAAVFEKKEN